MRAQSQKHDRADQENDKCGAPEVERQLPVVPERYEVDKRVAVALDYVKHGVQFEEKADALGHDLQVPEDRGTVKSQKQRHIHYLAGISCKYVNRRGDPADPKREGTHRQKVVQGLKPVKAEGHTVTDDQDDKNQKENEMRYE